ncbi:hypothetical protein NpNSSI1_00004378 [Neofusicoccum parvum]|nr:hypothetical protein NpNSSI1_00004378 [Neofusicoccum parvum]
MSRNKNITPHVNHIELCCTYAPIESAEANSPYVDRSRTASTSIPNSNKTPRGQKEAENHKSLVNDTALLLSDAVGEFGNLTGMKLTLEPDEALFGEIQGLQDHYKPEHTPAQYKRAFMSLWQVRVILQSLVKSSLVELDLVDVNNTPKVETTNDRLLFPSAWLSPLKSITTLKLDNRSESRYDPPDCTASGSRHVTSFLQAMPNLKTLHIKDEGCCWAAGIQDLLHQDYAFRLETFHLHHCLLLDLDGLTALLRKSSSTLRTLSVNNIKLAYACWNQEEADEATFNTWRKFLRTIRDDLDVENLELNGFASQYGYNMNTHIPIMSHHPRVRWHPDRLPDSGSELDEIIDERGIWKALSDWIDGMLVVYL